MDRKTNYILGKIGASIPKELLRKAIKVEKDNGELRARAEYAARKTNDPNLRAKIQEGLAKGAYSFDDTKTVDRNVEKQIEAYVDSSVRHAIETGKIDKASEADLKEWQRK